MPKTIERSPFRFPDTGAVAFCAGRACIKPHVADAALVATDRYYDFFAPGSTARSPITRGLAAFLEYEVGLSQLDARRFIRANLAWCKLMAEAQT